MIKGMPKKGTFFLKKYSTNTSFDALTIIDDDGYSFTLCKILIIGKIFLFGFSKVKFSTFLLTFINLFI